MAEMNPRWRFAAVGSWVSLATALATARRCVSLLLGWLLRLRMVDHVVRGSGVATRAAWAFSRSAARA
jgi:hypothetical protein